ncbi:MAG: hypothetical protein OEY64_01550 [Nitrospinota bacterium]|nr:hypothetical protein [Nitrospinota bacterium]
MTMTKKIAVFGTEPVTGKIGGLGIRQLEVARVLSKTFNVRLITPYIVETHREKFPIDRVNYHSPEEIDEVVNWADAVYTNQPAPLVMKMAEKRNKPVAVDLLALLYFEEMEHLPHDEMGLAEKSTYFSNRIEVMQRQISSGDFFICSNERERDYYLGILTMTGKLRPEEYGKGENFNSVIDIAPFGIPRKKPPKGKNILRGKIEGVGKNDFLIIWGGSLWNWYDSLTPVRAMARLVKTSPRAKLVFIPSHHPALKKPSEMYTKTLNFAKRKGLLNKNVFFHSEWVPYEEHGYYLTEADAGIATFPNHIENRFSFRIRLMDYIWGSLPILTNPGNTLSDLVEKRSLGYVVPCGDDKALAEKIRLLAARPSLSKAIRKNIEAVKNDFYWEKVLKPLAGFFKEPRKLKPLFHDRLKTLSISDILGGNLKSVLYLRSSPMEHSVSGIKAIRAVAPECEIDVVIQPGVVMEGLGENVNFLPLPANIFNPATAAMAINGKKSYDAVILSMNQKDFRYYTNVINFAAKMPTRMYWAFNDEFHFIDIKLLCKGAI